jgi:hypothetical protein
MISYAFAKGNPIKDAQQENGENQKRMTSV